MNWLDIVILVLVVINVVTGLKTGIIRAFFSFAGLIVGVVLAGRYYIPLAGLMAPMLQPRVAQVVAFVLILFLVMGLAVGIAALLRWLTSKVMLGWLDHLGGGVFGLLTGALTCAALLAIWVKFGGMSPAISGSSIAPILLDRFPAVLALLPSEFDVIRGFFH